MSPTKTGTTGPTPRKRRVTIDDLAGHLNLTKSTVSRALNGYTDISETTRLRVRRAADAMGYRPLSHAQAIRTGRVRSIGLVLQVSEHDGHRPFLAEFLAGVSAAASRADWTLTLATASSDEDKLTLLRGLCDQNKADGFILPRTGQQDARADFLRAANIPFVLYGRTSNPEGCAWYDIASEDSMKDAVCRLHALGHRRIGFVQGGAAYMYNALRLSGYCEGLKACGLPPAPELVRPAALNRAEGVAATRALLALDTPPTAILFAVDRAALGAWAVADDLGLTIGRDLSVISYDGIPEGALMRPQLSTFSVDTRHAGERLANLLIRRIRGEAPEALREIGQATFLDRGSHGKPALTSEQLSDIVRANSIPTGGNPTCHSIENC
ncbi:substrate-binding domain-containing protein [Mesobacterium sp. TK19101]|uniref:Substrate-binding domain-containing protein n=1 Tax=Mesobacterium hydrothermale TaxID=3111907 RepID=A0ABU6HFX4_9RHOB|nr:substrate-binding domain-containing protein [Mesobacterium sp. TK19101]MEC3861027.1 substrate-binding domain-containing protein [Mesobacterium sp. TK19101]